MLLQQSNRCIEFALLGFFEAVPPFAELFGVLDLPTHSTSMPLKHYAVKRICVGLWRPRLETFLAIVALIALAWPIEMDVDYLDAALSTRNYDVQFPTRRVLYSCPRLSLWTLNPDAQIRRSRCLRRISQAGIKVA